MQSHQSLLEKQMSSRLVYDIVPKLREAYSVGHTAVTGGRAVSSGRYISCAETKLI